MPTTGLDPQTRRQVWNVLAQLGTNHTILLTTQEMEEADVLADRVIIMSEGRILSDGTTHELKLKYGSGYQLKLMREPRMIAEMTKGIVQIYIPKARIKVC